MTNIILKSADSQCLELLPGQPDICVYQQQQMRWLCFADGIASNASENDIVQSVMDTTAPQRLILPYLQAMAAMLVFGKPDGDVLNLGFGGGALVRFIHHYLPNTQVTSVELQGAVVELARRHFAIPNDYPVFIDNAYNHLKHDRNRYALQLIDLPLECLLQPGLLQRCREHLDHDGIAILNLFYQQAQQITPVLAALRQQFPVIQLLDVGDSPNLIVLASATACLQTDVVTARINQLTNSSGLAVHEQIKQLIPVPINSASSYNAGPLYSD